MKPIESKSDIKEEDVSDAPDTSEEKEEEYVDTVVWETNKKLTEDGEGSIQIDVDSLVAEFEAEASKGVDADGRIRKRLEAIQERKRRHEELQDFEDYEID
ncbi:MAG: hypothetical protein ACR2QG_09265 [Gammaproteobacteria bacterium]